MPIINSNDSWTRLREVWLGDVYPAHFYDHLPPEVRDVFYQITEWTKQDLEVIEKKLQEFDIIVRRPQYHSVDNHIDWREQLDRPEIMPRDYFGTVGNTIYIPRHRTRQSPTYKWPWQHVIEDYEKDPESRVEYHEMNVHVSGANIVKVGEDIFIDCVNENPHFDSEQKRAYFETHVVPRFPDRRVHYLDNGGHIDGCFAILKPGYILATNYFDDYERLFPGWEIIMLSSPEFQDHYPNWYEPEFTRNGRWWLPDNLGNRTFNDHVLKYAQDWIGSYKETYFELNCLVIDENNVLMLGHNPKVQDRLAKIGINIHSVPFRCRGFWDGGPHCLTVDIRRDGHIRDYLGEGHWLASNLENFPR